MTTRAADPKPEALSQTEFFQDQASRRSRGWVPLQDAMCRGWGNSVWPWWVLRKDPASGRFRLDRSTSPRGAETHPHSGPFCATECLRFWVGCSRILLYIGAVLTGWITVLAMVMLVSDRAPAAVVIWPDAAFLNALPADVAIVGRSSMSVTLIGSEADVAKRLYQAGARLVLPSGLRGCAPPATSTGSMPKRQIVSITPP